MLVLNTEHLQDFTSGIQATIQSGRYVKDNLDPSIEYLELTLYDHTIDTRNFPGLRNEILTTVKITAPQGGNFEVSKTENLGSSSANALVSLVILLVLLTFMHTTVLVVTTI